MLNENAKKWVAALRSGKYTQAQEKLRRGKGFCCLGVACDVLGYKLPSDTTMMSLPKRIQLRLGLTTSEGRYGSTYLTQDNDTGKTFAEIAEIIESEPDGLFSEPRQ